MNFELKILILFDQLYKELIYIIIILYNIYNLVIRTNFFLFLQFFFLLLQFYFLCDIHYKKKY